jgi:hypothetical protein
LNELFRATANLDSMKFLHILVLACCCVLFVGAPHPASAADKEKLPKVRLKLKPQDLKKAPTDEELMALGSYEGLGVRS